MAAGLRLHLCPRLRAFAASFCPLLAAHPGALPPLRRAGQAVPLAARARRGFGTSLADAPSADADDFATGFVSQSPATSSFHRPLSGSS
jgi:peptide deformylase